MAHIDIGVTRHDSFYTQSTCSTCDAAQIGGVAAPNSRDFRSNVLQPDTWHIRAPFFATLGSNTMTAKEDDQSVIDTEITDAVAGTVDHWIFNFFPVREPSGNGDGTSHWAYLYGGALAKYKTSPNKANIKFCLNLQFTFCPWYPIAGSTDVITQVVAQMSDVQYKTVLGTRPLLFIHDPGGGYLGTINGLGSTWASTLDGFNALRSSAIAAGLGNPYIVAMAGFGPDSGQLAHVVAAVDQGLADAISMYVTNFGGTGTYNAGVRDAAVQEWTTYLNASTPSKRLVPFMSCGWDAQPQGEGGIYPRPTGAEWTAAVQAAIDFANAHPTVCETRTIQIYSWNEIAEGGYLVPTLSDSTLLLDATAAVSNPTLTTPVANFTAAQTPDTLTMNFTDTSS